MVVWIIPVLEWYSALANQVKANYTRFFPPYLLSFDNNLLLPIYKPRWIEACERNVLTQQHKTKILIPTRWALGYRASSFLAACLSVCLSACRPLAYLSVCFYVCLSAWLSASGWLADCLLCCLSVCLSICLSVCLSVRLSVCLSVFCWFSVSEGTLKTYTKSDDESTWSLFLPLHSFLVTSLLKPALQTQM